MLVASAHRLPAPIQEIPESPTPAPVTSASPQLQASPKPTPRSASTIAKSRSQTRSATVSHRPATNPPPTPPKPLPRKTTPVSSEPDGRLVVERSPTVGWNVAVRLKIDGTPVANISQGRRYDAPLAAGHHRLTVSAMSNTEPTSIELNVPPGRTEVFTAMWDSDRVVLRPSKLSAE
jgi:hypothetical protein